MKRKTQENKKQNELRSKANNMAQNKANNPKGITLIALVVTIVVLLILAGVSISLVLGNNGIIAKAQEAKVVTRAGTVEDEVALWRTDNYLAENTNGTAETDEQMIARLQTNKLITSDDEVDIENKVIKIKRSNGTIVKEISYEINAPKQVKINIRKTPETGDTTSVGIQVTSVEGMSSISKQDIGNMGVEAKKELIRKTEIMWYNKDEGTNFTTFEETLEYMVKTGRLESDTEEAFWEYVCEDLEKDLDSYLYGSLDDIAEYNSEKQEYEVYEVRNPEEQVIDWNIVQENGIYNFTVIDMLTNETYTKQVEVTNIKKLDYRVNNGYDAVTLIDKSNEEETTFEKAYIIYNNEKIDISSVIIDGGYNNDWSFMSKYKIIDYMEEIGKIKVRDEIQDTIQTLIIVKDNTEYIGGVLMKYLLPPL